MTFNGNNCANPALVPFNLNKLDENNHQKL